MAASLTAQASFGQNARSASKYDIYACLRNSSRNSGASRMWKAITKRGRARPQMVAKSGGEPLCYVGRAPGAVTCPAECPHEGGLNRIDRSAGGTGATIAWRTSILCSRWFIRTFRVAHRTAAGLISTATTRRACWLRTPRRLRNRAHVQHLRIGTHETRVQAEARNSPVRITFGLKTLADNECASWMLPRRKSRSGPCPSACNPGHELPRNFASRGNRSGGKRPRPDAAPAAPSQAPRCPCGSTRGRKSAVANGLAHATASTHSARIRDGTAADVLTQGQHGFAVECIPKIMLHRRIRWPGYEETGLHVPRVPTTARLRSIATHGRKRRFAQERGEVLVNPAELAGLPL